MPQLDTIYTLMTYLWTWITLYLISQKIETKTMTKNPTIPSPTTNKPTHTPQWL